MIIKTIYVITVLPKKHESYSVLHIRRLCRTLPSQLKKHINKLIKEKTRITKTDEKTHVHAKCPKYSAIYRKICHTMEEVVTAHL